MLLWKSSLRFKSYIGEMTYRYVSTGWEMGTDWHKKEWGKNGPLFSSSCLGFKHIRWRKTPRGCCGRNRNQWGNLWTWFSNKCFINFKRPQTFAIPLEKLWFFSIFYAVSKNLIKTEPLSRPGFNTKWKKTAFLKEIHGLRPHFSDTPQPWSSVSMKLAQII